MFFLAKMEPGEEITQFGSELEGLRAERLRPKRVSWEDSKEEEPEKAEESWQWTDLLPTTTVKATKEDAKGLCALLSRPPPWKMLKSTELENFNFSGIPTTPPPRKNKKDGTMYTAQRKMENALQFLAHYLETGEKQSIGVGAAWCRSAWEDLQQQRRGVLSVTQGCKWETRHDDHRARLLTRDEEQRIRPQIRGRPRAMQQWGDRQHPSSGLSQASMFCNRPGTYNKRDREKGEKGKESM
jgi:hypothetical protein